MCMLSPACLTCRLFFSLSLSLCTCMYVCVCMYVLVCMYVRVYMCVCNSFVLLFFSLCLVVIAER